MPVHGRTLGHIYTYVFMQVNIHITFLIYSLKDSENIPVNEYFENTIQSGNF